MSKLIVIGKGGNLTGIRNEETEKAVKRYCEEKNITVAEFEKSNFSIYMIEFLEDDSPISFTV
tara:strand:- start:5547 stop:5735 length:189 start_codon:yes stop_codon:yes gene_type:complete